MWYLLPIKCLAGGLLGSFRGGEIFTTGSTVTTRSVWATLLSVLVLAGHALSFALLGQAVALGVSFYVMMLIPHAFAQNGATEDMWEMGGVGLGRGAVMSLALYYWLPFAFMYILPGMALIQSLSYVIGYHFMSSKIELINGPTKMAEFIWGVGLTLLLCAVCGV